MFYRTLSPSGPLPKMPKRAACGPERANFRLKRAELGLKIVDSRADFRIEA